MAAGAGANFAASGGRLSGCAMGRGMECRELAACGEGAGGSQSGRIEVCHTTEIHGGLMDG